MSDNAYKRHRTHQQGWLFGMPESPNLLPLLKLRITPEEASILAERGQDPVSELSRNH